MSDRDMTGPGWNNIESMKLKNILLRLVHFCCWFTMRIRNALIFGMTICKNKMSILMSETFKQCNNNNNNNTKFVKRRVAVASEALANRTVKKHSRRRTSVL